MSTQTAEIKKRLKNVQGQIDGIVKMLDDERECVAILPQLKAARAGFDKAVTLFIEHNLTACLNQKCGGDTRLATLLRELFK